MGFWSKLFSAKGKKPKAPRMKGNLIPFYIKCDKCGEEITVRVNRLTDIQNLYTEPGEEGAAYTLKKEVLGKKCSSLMNIEIDFDRSYRIISQEISGGKFITPE